MFYIASECLGVFNCVLNCLESFGGVAIFLDCCTIDFDCFWDVHVFSLNLF